MFGKQKYTGYKQEDFTTAYAKYYNENIIQLSSDIKTALQKSPFSGGKIPSLQDACNLAKPGYDEIENGYTVEKDNSIHVAVLTTMPEVVPEMWDWWFSWHGDKSNKYKLWHPKAHISAQWKDGKENMPSYIGRTSMIEEYIGKKAEKADIQFISPLSLGFSEDALKNKEKQVFICARIGFTNLPVDFGWLVHQIRSTEGGSEMRSRFWMGGKYIQIKGNNIFANTISTALQNIVRLPNQQAADLLTHCSEEMNHLAKFLPKLYAEFH